MSEEKPDSATTLEIAMLAAAIDPAACRDGNCRDALVRAVVLFWESAAVCKEMQELMAKPFAEQTERVEQLFREGSPGAARLVDFFFRAATTVPGPMLTLAARDSEGDTLRPYLETNCNLEGKGSRKSWSTTRAVLKNLRIWLVDSVNTDNTKNAASIKARDIRDEEQARAKGCSVGEFNAGGWFGHPDQRWQDAEQHVTEFFRRYAVLRNGQPAGYSFPQWVVDDFIRWKRKIRTRKGGMSAVRPLSREGVFPKPIKNKNPKRRE